MRRYLIAFLAGLLLAPAPAGATDPCSQPSHDAGEWPLYGRDLANTRHQDGEDVIGPDEARTLAPAWTFSSADHGAGDFTGTPVTTGGCVFAGTNLGWLYAIDADTGSAIWAREVPDGGTINNSLAVADGTVYAYISRVDAPYVAAFDATDGGLRWTATVDDQPGADAFASPVVTDGLVFVGLSGDAAQHDDADVRSRFHGAYVIFDAGTGAVLHKEWTIPEDDWSDGYAGGTVTTTPAVDPVRKIAYVGTGSPFIPSLEHPRTNALLAVDLDRTSDTFGGVLASYKADTYEDVVPGAAGVGCHDLPGPPPPPIVPAGRGVGVCGDQDIDIAASPNLFTTPDGNLRVGTSQKSGTFHAVDATDLSGVWKTTVGPLQPFGGVSAAWDGNRLITGAAPPGQLLALDPSAGDVEWLAPIGDVAHYGIPVAAANGVAYTLDVKGFLNAYDATTGVSLLHRPILAGADGPLTFGGVSVARNTVFAAVGAQNTGIDFAGVLNGYIVAFRPAPLL